MGLLCKARRRWRTREAERGAGPGISGRRKEMRAQSLLRGTGERKWREHVAVQIEARARSRECASSLLITPEHLFMAARYDSRDATLVRTVIPIRRRRRGATF